MIGEDTFLGKFIRLCLFFVLASFLSTAIAATPTPEQLRLFQQLSPEQQQQALDALRSKNGTVSDQPLMEPPVVTPRPAQSDQAIEKSAQEGVDTPSLEEGQEEKQVTQKLEQFGYDLFAGTPTTFAPATDIPIPSDYIVGPGDNIQVQLFGKENAEYDLVVSREGQLRFPGIGPVSVAGLRFDELKQNLQDRISRQMIGVKANITMGTLRSIRIFVLGDAIRPGSYTVSALSNMTNALFVSGGIEPIGSLRNIQLKRSGKVITTLDLYDLLLKGDTSGDKRLLPGDVIFIPPIGNTIGVGGEVKRPAIYELKQDQTIEDALQFAGGFLPTAYPKESQIERITPSGERTLIDVDATVMANLKQTVRDGDVLRVYSILEKMQDIVLLSGHVQRPGGTQWRPGLRLTDVIPSVDVLLPKPDLDYVLIKRERQPDRQIKVITTRLREALSHPLSNFNTELQPRDEIIVFGMAEDRSELIAPIIEQLQQQARYGEPPKTVDIQGNVQFPGTYPLSENMQVSDIIRAAYDLKDKTDLDYSLLTRVVDTAGRIEASSFRLRGFIEDSNPSADFKLAAKDTIYIFSVGRDPDEITSQVGVIGETLIETKATEEELAAQEQKAKQQEGTTRQQLIMPVIEQLKAQTRQGEFTPIVSVSGLVTNPGQYPLDKNMKISDLIRAAGQLSESAYTLSAEVSRFQVVEGQYREIDHYTITKTDIYNGAVATDFTLKPYDSLHIKRVPQWTDTQTVQLIGEVKFPGVYPFKRGETLSDVLSRAGGLTDQAFAKGSVFTRRELQQKEQEQINNMAARLESDLAAINLEAQQAGKEAPDKQSVALANSLLAQLRNTKAVGRLVIDLDTVARKPVDEDYNSSDVQPVILKDGDKLYVPEQTQEVTIIGEVQQTTSHLYNPRLDRDDYINLSGGLTYKADKKRIYIVRANGAVVTDANTGWFSNGTKKVYSGDTIVVPLKADRMKTLTLWTNVTQIIYQLGVAAAAWNSIGVF
jgi:polysaccharide export outer membrane protein